MLNIRELVRRAGDIEQRLESGIARLTERLSQVSNRYGAHVKNPVDKFSKDLVVSRITHVFACAAQVYLNVVVSGPNSNLPEMRDNVARALMPSMPYRAQSLSKMSYGHSALLAAWQHMIKSRVFEISLLQRK